MELIPAIDLRGGQCVRLYQGNFDAQTVYSEEPTQVFDHYCSLGARRVHVVDLDGARSGAQDNLGIVKSLARRKTALLQVGGGLRDLARVRDLLEAGIERVVIGSVAVNAPAQVRAWMQEVGPSRVVLGFDVRLDGDGVPRLATHGWQEQGTISLWDAVEGYAAAGLVHVLCTDIARDGALSGPNFKLYREAVRRFPLIQWQASGGVAQAGDLHALRDCGVAAVISGKALLEKKISRQELQPFLPNASSPVST